MGLRMEIQNSNGYIAISCGDGYVSFEDNGHGPILGKEKDVRELHAMLSLWLASEQWRRTGAYGSEQRGDEVEP